MVDTFSITEYSNFGSEWHCANFTLVSDAGDHLVHPVLRLCGSDVRRVGSGLLSGLNDNVRQRVSLALGAHTDIVPSPSLRNTSASRSASPMCLPNKRPFSR